MRENNDNKQQLVDDIINKFNIKSESKQQSNDKISNIHTILTLDNSGSMSGDKINNAKQGLISILQTLDFEKPNGVFLYIFESYVCDYSARIYGNKLYDFINTCNGSGTTRLNETINQIYHKIQDIRNSSQETVFINIFTDGQATDTYTDSKKAIEYMLNPTNNCVLIFNCADDDKNTIKKTYNIPDANIISFKNTGEGVKDTFVQTRSIVHKLSKSLTKGESININNIKQ